MYNWFMKFGAHQSIAGGYDKALERVKKIGGNCLQIFSSSPRGWNFSKIDLKEQKNFIDKKKKLQIDPVYFHASYLVNLADDDRIGTYSKKNLINELQLAFQLGIAGSIVHLGSYKNFSIFLPYRQADNFQSNSKYKVLINNIKEVLEKTPKETFFIIENAGTRKIGQTLEEISQIIKDVGSNRVKLCLDTCHLYAAGYSFKNNHELNLLLDKLDKLNLLDRLQLWHANDSRDPFGSLRDRHENIGQGTLGLKSFKTLLNHPQTKNYPFIIETPGFDSKGPDKKNLDILKSLVL